MKTKKYIIIATTFSVIFFLSTVTYKFYNKFVFTKPKQIIKTSQEENKMTSMQKQTEENSKIVSLVEKMQTNKPQFNPETEHYAKLLLAILNINNQLQNESNPDIKFNLESVYSFTKGDSVLLKIFSEVSDFEEVHGINYFKNNFGKLVRRAIAYDNRNSNFFEYIYYTHIAQHFAYVSEKSSNPNAVILYRASTYLNSNKMIKFYEELSKLQSENSFYIEYRQNLENFIKVWNVNKEAKKYIEEILFEN